jgi:EamA domain-containing membrane protein RarD
MFDFLIVLIMVAIVVSLSFGLYFLVRDRGHTDHTVMALSVRVGLAVLLLVVLALGFISRSPA